MSDIVSFGKFGRGFQEGLCQLILEDRIFADRFLEVFCENYLELKYLRVFASKIIEYREEYNSHPGRSAMRAIIHTGLDDHPVVVKEQVNNFFKQTGESKRDDGEFIKKRALDFCRKQKLKEAMMKSMQLLDKSSYDKISKVINEALLLGSESDGGHDFHKDFEARYEERPRNPISTGWPLMDDICGGGHGQKELGVIIAPTGAGKSMALVHIGAAAVKEGHNVVYITLELASEVVGLRFDSCISSVQLGSLRHKKREVEKIVKDVKGQLKIKEYPTKTATTNTIRNYIEKLKRQGFEPDMLVIDYADLLRPVETRSEKRHDLESIYEELRGIGQEYNLRVWTASQTNRTGLNAEIITMEAISEAFNKCFVADFIFSISRTIEDRSTNQGRVFIAKNRNGPDGIVFPIFMDTSNVCIKVLPKNSEGDGTSPMQAQKERLSAYQMYKRRQRQ
jgi:replicative DNA helicase